MTSFPVSEGSLGLRLREERERLGYNQEGFGELGGISRNSQSSYERGDTAPTTAYLHAIEQRGADAVYILTGVRYDRETAQPVEQHLVTMQVAMPPRAALAEMFEGVLEVYPDLHGAALAQALARHLPCALAQLSDLRPAAERPTVPEREPAQDQHADRRART